MNETTSEAQDKALPRPHQVVLELDAAHHPGSYEIWAKQIAYLADSTLLDEADRARFDLKVAITNLNAMNLSSTWLSCGQKLVRTQEHIGRSTLSHLIFQHYVDATQSGRCHRREMSGQPGDITIFDLARPFEVTLAAGTIVALMVPREDLPPSLRDRDLHGLKADGGSAATRILAQAMRSFVVLAGSMTIEEGLVVCDGILKFIEAAFGVPGTLNDDLRRPADLSLLHLAQSYIESHIGDPALSAERLAAELRISRSTLYRVFEAEGSVGAYIRERRLLRAYEIITCDLRPHLPLGAVGFEQGFKSEAQFSRAFKERFGLSPSQARRTTKARRQAGHPAPPVPYMPGMVPLSHEPH